MKLRYALRTLRRDKGFAAVAILTLALGIGANTAIFSLVNGILLKSLPYPDADRIVTISEVIPKLSHLTAQLPVNARHFEEWRKNTASFAGMAMVRDARMNLTGDGEAMQVGASLVSAHIFDVLGVQPVIGRGFLEEDDRPGHNRVVVISDALWKQRFSGKPEVVGRNITIDGYQHTVVGVLPASFRFPTSNQLNPLAALEPRSDIFKPVAVDLKDEPWLGDFNYAVIARLKPGVAAEQGLADLNVVQAAIEKLAGEKVDLRADVTPLREQIAGGSRRGLLVMLGAVGVVLLIVCVNLANLMLARAVGRKRDIAVRAALGASRGELVGQVLTESALLAGAGWALGVIGACWGVKILVAGAPINLPRLDEVSIDAGVLLFSMLATAVTAIVFGTLPALKLTRTQPMEAMRSGGRSATDSAGGNRVRRLLVAAEVALSVMLLVAAGLLISSFVRLLKVHKGFETASVIAADVSLPNSKYPDEKQRVIFYDRMVEKIRTLPGVKVAGMTSALPLEGEQWVDIINVNNRPITISEIQGADAPLANYRFVTPGYFAAMGIALKQGRLLEDNDRNTHAALISERAAQRIFHGENPIGRKFWRGNPNEPPFEVAGVVGDVRTVNLQKDPPMMAYVGHWYRNRMKFTLVARTMADPLAIGPSIRAAIRELDPDIAIAQMRTMEQVLSDSVAQRRFQMMLVLLFAAGALTLASLGIYGVVSYTVTQRSGEMGIRMALGATSADLHRLVLGHGLTPVLGGLAIGIVGAIALGQVLSSLLFEVSSRDPITMAAVSLVLLTVAALACWMPARRAAQADPASVLRYE